MLSQGREGEVGVREGGSAEDCSSDVEDARKPDSLSLEY